MLVTMMIQPLVVDSVVVVDTAIERSLSDAIPLVPRLASFDAAGIVLVVKMRV